MHTSILNWSPTVRQRNTIFQWRFAGGPMMAPDGGVIFQGRSGPPVPPLDPHLQISNIYVPFCKGHDLMLFLIPL